MSEGIIMVFSNPASADKEAEFNDWYSGIHFDELTAPDGVKAAHRYKIHDTQIPGNPPSEFGYLSVYEIDDIDKVYREMRAIPTTPSDAIHPVRRQIIFEKIHSRTKD